MGSFLLVDVVPVAVLVAVLVVSVAVLLVNGAARDVGAPVVVAVVEDATVVAIFIMLCAWCNSR